MMHHSVLVVEDDADVRGAVATVLEMRGYDVVEAQDGREALEALRAEPARFCLVVLDLFMPEMDGWTFRAEQMKDPHLATIPVLVVTADALAARRAVSTGVIATMTKPVDLDRLIGTVERYC